MTSSPIHIVAISGSLRMASFNTATLRAAADVAPPDLKVEIVPIGSLPFYDGDVEASGIPPAVAELREAIGAADGLLIASPEYNWSITGVLKNAIDWASRGGTASPLYRKTGRDPRRRRTIRNRSRPHAPARGARLQSGRPDRRATSAHR